jgi:hypothetical protein
MANHTTVLANSINQSQSTPTIYLNIQNPTTPESYQPIVFGVLGVSLALGSIYLGYLQLKHAIRHNLSTDVEMGVVGYDIGITSRF